MVADPARKVANWRPGAAVPEPDVGLGALVGVRVVLVGTGIHADTSDLPDVPAVAATLNDLKQALIDRCGVAETAVKVVPDPKSIEDFGTPITDAAEQAEDLLLVYYVGHGLLADDGTLHLATAKSPSAGQRIRVTSLPYATVRACVADSPARSRVVILDCCYSGIAVPALGSAGPQVADLARIAGAFVMTATGRHELALAPPDERHTAFTGALLRLLEAGDPDLPELLTLEDAFRHLDRVLPAAQLPKPRRMAEGTVASLVVARNPGVRIALPEPQPVSRLKSAKVTAGECPYKGLAAFDAADERWFFGRSELVNTAVRRLAECVADAQPLVVLGASGAGKSSLLRAGVLPALARGELGVAGSAWWPRRVFTPTADPVGELARQLADLTDASPDRLTDVICGNQDGLPDLLRHPGRGRVVLVVDQFEELFAPDVPTSDRKAFVRALTTAASDATGAPAALVVLGVRADFFGQCAELPELTAALDNRPLMVRAMTRDQTREAITVPATRSGLTVDSALVEVLLADLGSEPSGSREDSSGVADQPCEDELGAYEPGRLPLLSHALRMTWYEQDDGTLSVDAYRRTGGIHRALAATADRVLGKLNPAGQTCARLLFLRLVHIGEDITPTRRRVSRERLLADLPDPVLGAEVLNAFAGPEARLVTADKHTVEITHEALIHGWPALRGWIDQDRAGLVTEQHLIDDARDWDAARNDTALLYRGSRLDTALTWAAEADHRRQLPLLAQRFLTASERQETRRKRVRTGLVIVLTVMLVAALGGLVAAWAATDRARKGERAAVAERLRLKADTLLTEDPVTALRLAVAAHNINPGDASRLSETVSKSRLLGVMPHPNSALVAAEFSPKGRILVTAGDDTVTLWRTTDLARPVVAAQLTDLADFGYPNGISSLAISADGRTLAVAGGGVQLWDISDPANPQPLGATFDNADRDNNDNPDGVYAVAFHSRGPWLATAAGYGEVHIWNLTDPARPVLAAVRGVPPESPGADNPEVAHGVGAVAFSPDGRTLAAGGYEQTGVELRGLVSLWDVADPADPVIATRKTTHDSAVGSLRFSPDGRTLVVGGDYDDTGLWDVSRRKLKPIATLTNHASVVSGVAFSPDGRMVATASDDETAMLWDVTEPGRPLRTAVLENRGGPVNAVAFSRDGQTVVTAGDGNPAMLWTVAEPGQVSRSVQWKGHTAALSGVAFSPDGRTVATGSWDGTAKLWDAGQRKPVATLAGHTSDVFTVAFSPDGNTLATGSKDKSAMLWHVADPSRPSWAARLPSRDVVSAVAFSPDGDTLAAGSWLDGTALWNVTDPASPRRVGTADGDSLTFGASFSPDGHTLAASHADWSVTLWRVSDPAHPARSHTLVGHTAEVNAVAFSRKRHLLATGAQDNTARLWDVADADDPSLAGVILHHNHVLEVAFTPDGRTLATASLDRTVDLWNVVNPKHPVRIATLRGHTAEVSGVAFSPDGRTLASSSYDTTARLWNVARHVAISSDPLGYACAVTHGGLTPDQWADHVSELDYRQTCPSSR